MKLYEARIIPKRNWTLDDFVRGDRLLLTYRSAHDVTKRAAEVTVVDFRGKGYVNFGPDYRRKYLPAGQGTFYPEEIGAKRFGLVDVEIIEKSPRRNRQFNEARQINSSNFFRTVIDNMFEPEGSWVYEIPDNISTEEVKRVFTKEFGKPRTWNGTTIYEWEVPMPMNELRKWSERQWDDESPPTRAYIDFRSQSRVLYVGVM